MAAWNKIVEGARDAREATIPSELRLSNIPGFHFPEPGSNVIPTIESCGLLTEPELNLTSLSHDSTWLLQQLLSQKMTSMEVVGAFCRRAAIAHQLVNCLVDYFPTVALDRARYLDAYMAEHGKPIGPLHGLPISIKGQFNLEGHDAGAGAAVIAWVGKRVAPSHAHICQILYDAGAVFYCQTATPEGSIGMECDSPLWGTTTNPLNTCLTPGGSSGGEAALIATGGSPLGVGCDSGGSLRSPAQHCGLYTIRTTERRFPLSGCNSMWEGNNVIEGSSGPMARSIRDLDLFSRVVLKAEPWTVDPGLIPLPWTPVTAMPAMSKLRVGIMKDDGVVMPTPSVLRALAAAECKLAAESTIEVVRFEPYRHEKAASLALEGYWTDGGEACRAPAASINAPQCAYALWVLSQPEVKLKTQHELWDYNTERSIFRSAYQDHWQAAGIDVLICPTYPGPAPPFETSRYWGYTSVWNLLDYPSVVLPSSIKVDSTLDQEYQEPFTARNKAEKDFYEALQDSKAPVEGMPIGLQVVGQRYRDEKVLAVATLIDQLLKD